MSATDVILMVLTSLTLMLVWQMGRLTRAVENLSSEEERENDD